MVGEKRGVWQLEKCLQGYYLGKLTIKMVSCGGRFNKILS